MKYALPYLIPTFYRGICCTFRSFPPAPLRFFFLTADYIKNQNETFYPVYEQFFLFLFLIPVFPCTLIFHFPQHPFLVGKTQKNKKIKGMRGEIQVSS